MSNSLILIASFSQKKKDWFGEYVSLEKENCAHNIVPLRGTYLMISGHILENTTSTSFLDKIWEENFFG